MIFDTHAHYDDRKFNSDRDELLKRWEYLVEIHPGNNKWVEFKENALKHYDEKSTISYLGFLGDEIICEATAYVKNSAFIGDISDPSGLLSDNMAYLAAFRTNKEHEGKGYFSKLYKFIENDLKMVDETIRDYYNIKGDKK